ncbi:polysaccharide deacetylase family protein [Macrococcus sp. FSL R5-0951]
MDVNSIKTKNNFHNYITIKQLDTKSDIELLLCGNDGSLLTELNEECIITIFDDEEKEVRQITEEKIMNGVLTFKIVNDLLPHRHKIEVTTSSGTKFPADDNFQIFVTETIDNKTLEIIKSIPTEIALKVVTQQVLKQFSRINDTLGSYVNKTEINDVWNNLQSFERLLENFVSKGDISVSDININNGKIDLNLLSEEVKAALVNNTPKGVFNTLDELQKAYPKGATGIYIVKADGFWYYYKEGWIKGLQYQTTKMPDELTFSGQNYIFNGMFANGTTGWSSFANDSMLSVDNNILSSIGKGKYGTLGVSTQSGYRFTAETGDKLYVKARVRVTDELAEHISIYAVANGVTVHLNNQDRLVIKPLYNTWYEIDGFIDVPQSFNNSEIALFFVTAYASPSISLGKTFQIYRPLAINVSKIFKGFVTPTIEDIRKYLKNFSNSWFDGSVTLLSLKDYLADLQNKIDILNDNQNLNKNGTYKLLTDFSDIWKVSENTENVYLSDDIRINLTGQKSKKLEILNSEGISTGIERTANVMMTSRSKAMMLKVWIEDSRLVKNITVYLGNEDNVWSNYARLTIMGDASGNASVGGGLLRNGWNYIAIVPSEMVITNKFNWDAPIKRIKVAVTPKTNEKTSVVFDSIQYNGIGVPKLVLTFDDGWKTVYDNAYPKMKSANIVGTFYLIGQYVDNPSNPISPHFCTKEQLKEMEKHGWVHSNHTWQHNYYFGGNHTPTSYVATLEKNRDWMLDNGFAAEGTLHVCYPNGEYDKNVIALMKAKGFKSARAAKCRQNNPIQIDNEFEIASRNFTKDVTLEQAKKWIDYAIESGGTTFLQFHQIPLDDTVQDETANPYISWSKDKFIALIDYIVEKGLAQHCLTHSGWYDWAKRNDLIGK